MVYILPDFQRKGLLPHALAGYHESLSQLPEWYAFGGTLLLVPAGPSGKRGTGWGAMEDEAIENKLIESYKKYGQYRVYVKDANVRGRAVTVMGRTVPHQESDQESDQ